MRLLKVWLILIIIALVQLRIYWYKEIFNYHYKVIYLQTKSSLPTMDSAVHLISYVVIYCSIESSVLTIFLFRIVTNNLRLPVDSCEFLSFTSQFHIL